MRLRHADHGFVTIQYVAATALSLVLLVLVANLLVDLYVRGAIRDALDEGVRAAAPIDAAPAGCDARAHEVLDALVHGPVARVDVQCAQDGAWVRADARVELESWLPMLIPAWRMELHAEALREG